MRPVYGLALALCCTAALPAAHADDASRKAKAEQMLVLTKTDSLMEGQLASLQTRVNELAKQQSGVAPLTPEQTKLTADYQKQIHDIVMEEVGWVKIRPVIVQSYADSFTEPELDAILVFYKTPAGQAIIAKTPDLANKTMSTVQGRIKDMQPKLATLTQEYMTKLKAAAPAAAPAGAPTAAPAPKPSLK
ncbi:MAG: DUF2059 domain-containing protein [Janthinobacterium lividum]